MNSMKKRKYYLWNFPEVKMTSFITAILMLFMLPFTSMAEVDISDAPLDTMLQAAPANFMVVLDDSGSMDWEVMTKETDGVFDISGVGYEYIFDDPAAYNLYTSGNNSQMLTGSTRMYWKSQWSGHNGVYYNSSITYAPWYGLSNANTTTPKSHPKYSGNGITLSDTYVSVNQTNDINIDDSESLRTQISGTWSFDAVDHWTTSAGNVFRWLPVFDAAGTYEVKVYISSYNDADTKATYKIKHGAVIDTVVKSQRNVGGWISLGSYSFAAGSADYVTVERTGDSTRSYTIADKIQFVSSTAPSAINIPNAHFYAFSTTENKPYLVTIGASINYYAINDSNNNGQVEEGEITTAASPPADVTVSRSASNELQNFANWYQFYRKRMYTAIAAISDVIPKLKGVKVGLYSINQFIVQTVLSVNISGQTDYTQTLLDLVQNHKQDDHPQSSTPLRKALEAVGQYYHKDDGKTGGIGASPLLSSADGGDCQQNFVMVFSDGADNGQSPGIGDADKDMGAPYQDNYSVNTSDNIYPEESNDSSQANTLADVAMYYYKNDLNAAAANSVPPSGIDTATHQHMVTYTVGFGVTGNLDKDGPIPNSGTPPKYYNIYASNTSDRVYPNWPGYASNDADTAARIDDMWHAAVNGRGEFYNAKNPEELIDAFNKIVTDVLGRLGSAASVTINGEEFTSDSVLYQSSYSSLEWSGDVKAYKADQTMTATSVRVQKWGKSANWNLFEKNWNDRVIATYSGASGIPFRYNNLTAAQKAALDANYATTDKAQKVLNFLRGDSTNETNSGAAGGEDLFRRRLYSYTDPANPNNTLTRDNKLGDIVHSAPTFMNDMIYVGANDGMMHAFRAADGVEAFAYVPNLVFSNLAELSKSTYSHKYYVDMTPFAKKIGGNTTLLVGALGKGGKGIYCLDITNAASIVTEEGLASIVKWEFPNASTSAEDVADMGYSFSKPYIVKSHDPDHPYIVVFGNGYNSTNQIAKLFVVDAFTGALLNKIDTGVGGSGIDNGLSTPNAVDVDGDNIFDYVYAGDLRGNMWKFNIKSSSASSWGLSYNSALFTAKGPAGVVQPITSRPDVMLHCQAGLPGYIVVFGTGKFLGVTDFSDSTIQTIYGLWDYGDDADKTEFLGTFNRAASPNLSNFPNGKVTLLKQEVVYFDAVTAAGTDVRVLSNYKPTWLTEADSTAGQNDNPSSVSVNHAGWYFDFPAKLRSTDADLSKERVIQDIIIRDGNAIVISTMPTNTDKCKPGGSSIFHEIDACGGGRTDRPHLDLNQDGKLDDVDKVTLTLSDGSTVKVAASGVYHPNMVYLPSIANAGDGTEIKYLSTAAGTITTLREVAEKKGIFYWRSY